MPMQPSDLVIVGPPGSTPSETATTALLDGLREDGTGDPIHASWEAAFQDASSREGLFEARRGSRVVGAVWGPLRAGRSAEILPLWIRSGEEEEIARRLLGRLDEYLSAAQAIGRQAIILGVDAGNDPAIAVYVSVGFLAVGRKSVLFKVF